MFIYFEGFFKSLAGTIESIQPVTSVFSGLLSISPAYDIQEENGYCVDITLSAQDRQDEAMQAISGLGESVVVIPGRRFYQDSSPHRRRGYRARKGGIPGRDHALVGR